MQRVAELVRRWRSAFSDFRIEVGDVIADRHWVVSVETLSETRDGIYHSRIGPIEPTGRHVTWSRIPIRTLEGDRFHRRVLRGGRDRPARPARSPGP